MDDLMPPVSGVTTVVSAVSAQRDVYEYEVFKEVRALYVLVPALLGLKGNLDMCLASRLSTQANLGNMKDRKELLKMIIGNMLLVQVQAIIASCLVSLFAVSASAAINGNFQWIHTLLLATSSILTATLSCFILDIVLVSVILLSHKIKLNPDNLATPMAASIGDVVSLIVLSSWATLLFEYHDHHCFIPIPPHTKHGAATKLINSYEEESIGSEIRVYKSKFCEVKCLSLSIERL
ncbi:hypothetical protein NQ317_006087 [Molorchus minor]|uniref:SLC41A/MgtE integral membrane domain-containing protein n=1 Tax=Molorchus minor TaxID=1323400 RepID=A0ABQ9ITE1_9CUCU|nr:hypothetical protein NQ317_006087 [Molorchus minor]